MFGGFLCKGHDMTKNEVYKSTQAVCIALLAGLCMVHWQARAVHQAEWFMFWASMVACTSHIYYVTFDDKDATGRSWARGRHTIAFGVYLCAWVWRYFG